MRAIQKKKKEKKRKEKKRVWRVLTGIFLRPTLHFFLRVAPYPITYYYVLDPAPTYFLAFSVVFAYIFNVEKSTAC